MSLPELGEYKGWPGELIIIEALVLDKEGKMAGGHTAGVVFDRKQDVTDTKVLHFDVNPTQALAGCHSSARYQRAGGVDRHEKASRWASLI